MTMVPIRKVEPLPCLPLKLVRPVREITRIQKPRMAYITGGCLVLGCMLFGKITSPAT